MASPLQSALLPASPRTADRLRARHPGGHPQERPLLHLRRRHALLPAVRLPRLERQPHLLPSRQLHCRRLPVPPRRPPRRPEPVQGAGTCSREGGARLRGPVGRETQRSKESFCAQPRHQPRFDLASRPPRLPRPPPPQVDPKRIYIAGQEAGGFMAFRFACDFPELVAGAPPNATHATDWPRGLPRPALRAWLRSTHAPGGPAGANPRPARLPRAPCAGVASVNGGMLKMSECAAFSRPAASASAVSALFINGAFAFFLDDALPPALPGRPLTPRLPRGPLISAGLPTGLDNTLVPFGGGRFGGAATGGTVPAIMASAGEWALNNGCANATKPTQLSSLRLLPHLCAPPPRLPPPRPTAIPSARRPPPPLTATERMPLRPAPPLSALTSQPPQPPPHPSAPQPPPDRDHRQRLRLRLRQLLRRRGVAGRRPLSGRQRQVRPYPERHPQGGSAHPGLTQPALPLPVSGSCVPRERALRRPTHLVSLP